MFPTSYPSEHILSTKNTHLNKKLELYIENDVKYTSTPYLINIFAQYQLCSCANIIIVGHVDNIHMLTSLMLKIIVCIKYIIFNAYF